MKLDMTVFCSILRNLNIDTNQIYLIRKYVFSLKQNVPLMEAATPKIQVETSNYVAQPQFLHSFLSVLKKCMHSIALHCNAQIDWEKNKQTNKQAYSRC